jgi:hypothetical protein
MVFVSTFTALTDDQLLAEIQRLATNERRATAILVRALMEVDARRLFLREGCSSLFTSNSTMSSHMPMSTRHNPPLGIMPGSQSVRGRAALCRC